MEKTIETISVDGLSFKMVMTSEEDGYMYTSRTYDLYFENKRISKDVPSIKLCYWKAYEYSKNEK